MRWFPTTSRDESARGRARLECESLEGRELPASGLVPLDPVAPLKVDPKLTATVAVVSINQTPTQTNSAKVPGQSTALTRVMSAADAVVRLQDSLTRMAVSDPFASGPTGVPSEQSVSAAFQQLADALLAAGVPESMIERLFGPTAVSIDSLFPNSDSGAGLGLDGQPGWTSAPDLMASWVPGGVRTGLASVTQSLPDKNGTVTIKYDDGTVVRVQEDGTVTFENRNTDTGTTSTVKVSGDNSTITRTVTNTDNSSSTIKYSTNQFGTVISGTRRDTNGNVVQFTDVEIDEYGRKVRTEYPQQGIRIFRTWDAREQTQTWELQQRRDFVWTTIYQLRSQSWTPAPDDYDPSLVQPEIIPLIGWFNPTSGLTADSLVDPVDEFGGKNFDVARFARSLAAYLMSKVNPVVDGPQTGTNPPGIVVWGGGLPDPVDDTPVGTAPAPKPSVGPNPVPPLPPGGK